MWDTFKKLAASLGPGLITAALVLGPGSVTTVSKTGALYGYSLIWVVAGAGVLMGVYVVMSARIGTVTDKTLLGVVSEHYGRWLAVIMGISSFLVCCSFQAGDNQGVSISMQSIFADFWPQADSMTVIKAFSAGFTLISLALILSAPSLYKVIERLMTVLVAVMIICFVANLFPARPSAGGIARGLIPSMAGAPPALVVPLVATTFSVIAALYQSYMVQNKGWKIEDYRKGIWDSIVGIAVLTGLSVVIMITAAAVLHPRGIQVQTAGDMARQLEPLLGKTAKWMFCVGLWGASFSSLMANAIVGGGLLADSLGLGSRFESRGVKTCTVIVMLVGAAVVQFFARHMLDLIVVAQAITILFVPLCALMLLLVANNRKVMVEHVNRWGMNLLGILGLLTVSLLGAFQFWRLIHR